MQDYSNYSANAEISSKSLVKRVVINKVLNAINNGNNVDYTDYATFKKNYNLDNVMKHFKNDLNDSDFKNILDDIVSSNNYDENMEINTKSHSKQLGLKTSAGALFKEE